MNKYCLVILGLSTFIILNACNFSNGFVPVNGFDPDFPIKDDPTTLGNFESSQFDGFWQVKNLTVDWNNPPIYDYQPLYYVFNKNSVQNFGRYRDWSTDNSELTGEIRGREATEFMYSNTNIYTIAFYDYKTWDKIGYSLSSDENSLVYGRNNLEKMALDSWTKEDLIGSWYFNNTIDTITLFTFTDNLFIIQAYTNGIPNDGYTHASTAITLTDKSFTGKLDFYGYGLEQPEMTCYYYIIDNRLFLSNGYATVLNRFHGFD